MTGFLFSLNSSTIKPTPILRKIAIAGEAGYSAIELWHDDIDAFLSAGGEMDEIRNAVEDAGLVVPTTIFLKGWWDKTGAEDVAAMDEIKRRLEQAAAVGAKHSIAGPPLGPVDFVLGAERYARLLDVGREFGVRPVMEYLGFSEQMNTIEAALRVIEGSGHPDATIVHDPFHVFRGGGSFESILKTPAERIAICHFNDAPATPPRTEQHDPDRVMPGDGCVDLNAMLSRLRQVGYDRWLSLELFRRDLWEQDPLHVARTGLEKMRAVVSSIDNTT